jgi:hypothetical protein
MSPSLQAASSLRGKQHSGDPCSNAQCFTSLDSVSFAP